MNHHRGAVSLDGDILFILEVHRRAAQALGILVALGAIGAKHTRQGKGILGTNVVDGARLQRDGGIVLRVQKQVTELIHNDSPFYDVRR